ncbi:type II secretion system F family protein [Arthrobacter agilis]|uniref:type II secretion system F family protein n=1 Tax=Arthrobacter agilis TaxID=37921 RepID=UPI002365F3C7|nr:type II secretion system F family protein [Arthrobacter agilis]WDF32633.1 type II secretion system F family protein [Arthrobacter agilis]
MTALLLAGSALLVGAVVLALVAARPRQSSVPVDRRRPAVSLPDSQLSRFAGSAGRALDAYLRRNPKRFLDQTVLETAGVRLSQAEVYLLILLAGISGLFIGWALLAPIAGVLFLLLSPVGAYQAVLFLTTRRRRRFDAQLGDTLQLLTGGLRAGHSILRAIDAAATEADSPTSEEMRRIVAETGLGKDLLASLVDTAHRMQSEDFEWIAQAIQINREVGGDLAEVLDEVGHTIRERSEIKGQIKALAAEGKFSAYILAALPFGIALVLTVISPGYIDVLFVKPLGWVMLGAAAVMMAIGGLWLRKIIDLKF